MVRLILYCVYSRWWEIGQGGLDTIRDAVGGTSCWLMIVYSPRWADLISHLDLGLQDSWSYYQIMAFMAGGERQAYLGPFCSGASTDWLSLRCTSEWCSSYKLQPDCQTCKTPDRPSVRANTSYRRSPSVTANNAYTATEWPSVTANNAYTATEWPSVTANNAYTATEWPSQSQITTPIQLQNGPQSQITTPIQLQNGPHSHS